MSRAVGRRPARLALLLCRQDAEGARTRMAKESNHYARRFWVPTALALFTPPTLLAVALLIHSALVMNLVLFSSFLCIFISLIVVVSVFISWMFGKVEFIHIRLAAALAVLGFVTNYFVFYFVVYKFYRPH